MTSSQYIIRYIDNQPVCSDTLMYLSYMRLNLRKKMLHFCRMKYYNFSIIFEMSTTFSMKKPVNLHGQVCRKLRETHRNIKWNSFRLSVPFWISLTSDCMHVISTRFDWNCSTTQARIQYLPGGQSTKWVVEWKSVLCKLQNEWLNNKMFSHLRAQVASRYTLPTAAKVFLPFSLFF